MASSLGHAAVAAGALWLMQPHRPMPRRYWVAGIAAAVLLDIDAVGRPFGMGDPEFLGGHRGLTHSMPFAMAMAVVLAVLVARPEDRRRTAAAFFVATAAHGMLDSIWSFGGGVRLLWPFVGHRYQWPVVWAGTTAEVLLLWLPAILVIIWTHRGRESGV